MIILGIDPGTINCGYSILELVGTKKRLVEAGLIKIKDTSRTDNGACGGYRFYSKKAQSR
jgi:Holliday junction resolvasome RuvABC endonuclease subunit